VAKINSFLGLNSMQSKFSQDIELLLQRLVDRPLTLQEILAETSERGFCLIISLLALPFLIPVPPGLSTILGLGCLLLSGQMALGRRVPWLPQRIGRVQFPKSFSQALLSNLDGITKRLEKVVRPRLPKIANHSYIWRLNGACIAWLTILLMLPIPATNPIPTVGILLLAVATLEGDGLLMGVGYGLTAAITLAFGGIFYVLWQLPQALPAIFR
jgi:hypothetical protein